MYLARVTSATIEPPPALARLRIAQPVQSFTKSELRPSSLAIARASAYVSRS